MNIVLIIQVTNWQIQKKQEMHKNKFLDPDDNRHVMCCSPKEVHGRKCGFMQCILKPIKWFIPYKWARRVFNGRSWSRFNSKDWYRVGPTWLDQPDWLAVSSISNTAPWEALTISKISQRAKWVTTSQSYSQWWDCTSDFQSQCTSSGRILT